MAQIERMLVWAIDETAGFDSSWATINEARLVADGPSRRAPANAVLDDLSTRHR
jgi:hypothetical protein